MRCGFVGIGMNGQPFSWWPHGMANGSTKSCLCKRRDGAHRHDAAVRFVQHKANTLGHPTAASFSGTSAFGMTWKTAVQTAKCSQTPDLGCSRLPAGLPYGHE